MDTTNTPTPRTDAEEGDIFAVLFEGRISAKQAIRAMAAESRRHEREAAAAAIRAYDSLPEYDKAVEALKDYLPEWVCFVAYEEGRLRMFGEHADPFFLDPVWGMTASIPDPKHPGEHILVKDFKFLGIPKPYSVAMSLRRITHNSDGTVTVERG